MTDLLHDLKDEITATPDVADHEPPSIRTPGWILVDVHVLEPAPTSAHEDKCEYEVLEWEGFSSVFWINEGVGFDWWLEERCQFPSSGVYLIENIRGDWIRGDGWMSEDREEWDHNDPRLATPEEIARLAPEWKKETAQ